VITSRLQLDAVALDSYLSAANGMRHGRCADVSKQCLMCSKITAVSTNGGDT
jgi:hypothetical protein